MKKRDPITTKRWNPRLPPQEALPVAVEGSRLIFVFAREVVMDDGEHPPRVAHAYVGGGYVLLVSIDNTIHGRLLHFSLSAPSALPPWALIAGIKRALFPADVAAVLHLPEEAVYVNVHEHCLHVWQLPVQWNTG